MFDINVERNAPSKKVNTNKAFALSFSTLNALTSNVVVCKHDIIDDQLRIGKPISTAALNRVISSVISPNTQKRGEWNNHNIIYTSEKLLVWHRASSKQAEPIWFRVNGKQVEFSVFFPSLIFAFDLSHSKLFIFSSGSNQSPNATTKLYHAPLCNIYSNGSLCFGAAKIPSKESTTSTIMQICEDAIFKTLYTHTNHDKTWKHGEANVTTKQHIKFWSEQEKLKKKPLANQLNSLKLKLGEWIEQKEKNNG